ncbi:hypothetical protein IWX90DRAFT_104315 [Phyllosticta citrichinensis]|uniref:Uncharacterized protein n=1 Tax=Phyllosticta citrichinensis TaxID=1130410 RepID=A0ABR1Y258_9PEZI
MPQELPCPLPQVQEALNPYIRPRHETLRIRKVLAEQFQAHFPATDQLLNPLSAPFPPLQSVDHHLPPEYTGLRKAYFGAVQSKQRAQKRCDDLQSELQEFRTLQIIAKAQRHNAEGNSSEERHSGAQAYAILIEQRRRQKELQILLNALDAMDDTEPNSLRRDLFAWLDETLGEAPIPPPEIGGDLESTSNSGNGVQDEVMPLKKEVLAAKKSLDAEVALQADARRRLADAPSPEVEIQVLALRAARDELIAWIEGELAKLAQLEEQSQLSVDHRTPTKHMRHESLEGRGKRGSESIPPQDQVQVLYERYIAARRALVSGVDAATTFSKEIVLPYSIPSATNLPISTPSAEAKENQVPQSDVLPYVHTLLRAARDERALLQQTSYVRSLLSQKREEAQRIIQKLASESHLVPQDAESALAWADASREAAMKSEEEVMQSIEAGAANIEGAKKIVEELDKRKLAFERLSSMLLSLKNLVEDTA